MISGLKKTFMKRVWDRKLLYLALIAASLTFQPSSKVLAHNNDQDEEVVDVLIENGAVMTKTDSSGHPLLIWDLFDTNGKRVGHSEYDVSSLQGDWPEHFQISVTLVREDSGARINIPLANGWSSATEIEPQDPEGDGTNNTRMVMVVNAEAFGSKQYRGVNRVDYRSLADFMDTQAVRCRHCTWVLKRAATS